MSPDIPSEPTPAQRRLLELIRRLGPVSPTELAEAAATTGVAVRQHLQVLAEQQLVSSDTLPPKGRGRPATVWSVTDRARAFLPDSHAELTVGLISAIEAAVGKAGLERVLDARGAQQAEAYGESVRRDASLATRVKALARLRSRDGYMAEAQKDKGGAWLLIEHHCPVCEAATRCQGICRVELDVFQKVLGPDVHVARTEHLLAEGRRCVYRISPKD